MLQWFSRSAPTSVFVAVPLLASSSRLPIMDRSMSSLVAIVNRSLKLLPTKVDILLKSIDVVPPDAANKRPPPAAVILQSPDTSGALSGLSSAGPVTWMLDALGKLCDPKSTSRSEEHTSE